MYNVQAGNVQGTYNIGIYILLYLRIYVQAEGHY